MNIFIKEEGLLKTKGISSSDPTNVYLMDDHIEVTYAFVSITEDENLGMDTECEFEGRVFCKKDQITGINIDYYQEHDRYKVDICTLSKSVYCQIFKKKEVAYSFYNQIKEWILK